MMISILSEKSFSVDLSLLDVSGRLYHGQQGYQINAGSNARMELPMDGIPTGIYIVRLVSIHGIISRMFVVQL